jgi:hypothetical protein
MDANRELRELWAEHTYPTRLDWYFSPGFLGDLLVNWDKRLSLACDQKKIVLNAISRYNRKYNKMK